MDERSKLIENRLNNNSRIKSLFAMLENRDILYDDFIQTVESLDAVVFSEFCLKGYKSECEPEYCIYRATGECEYISAIKYIKDQFGIDIINRKRDVQ